MPLIDPVNLATGLAVVAIEKLLGPAYSFLKKEVSGVQDIIKKAINKTPDLDDNKYPNLRVARDVFWNGSFSDDAISAEYFGGVLASSRSGDGKDDSAIFYVDMIKSLSSAQLKAHYILYRILNKFFVSNKIDINVTDQGKLDEKNIFIVREKIEKELSTDDPGFVFMELQHKGLIRAFHFNNKEIIKTPDGKELEFVTFVPTSIGIKLFSVAYNKSYKNFKSVDFGDFPEIELPKKYGDFKKIKKQPKNRS